VAEIAVETGISPQALLDCEPEMLATIIDVLTERAEEAARG
jgi:hypothetical protein